MAKHKNKKCTMHGFTFDSKKERDRYIELVHLQNDGYITNLELQPEFKFTIPGGKEIKYKSKRAVKYRADFKYYEDGKVVVEDVKGFKTPEYKLKWAMMKFINGIEVKET